jgi:hypothetical protein
MPAAVAVVLVQELVAHTEMAVLVEVVEVLLNLEMVTRVLRILEVVRVEQDYMLQIREEPEAREL